MAVSEGLYVLLTQATAAVQALLAAPATDSLYFSLAAKQAPRPYVVLHIVDAPPAAATLDGSSALIDGEFQFDSCADDQPTARQLSQAVRDALKELSGTLSDGTTIQFYEVSQDFDAGYDLGGDGYIYRSVLRLRAFYTETGTPYVPQLLQGYGAPTSNISANNDDLYLDLSTGNVYEMVAGTWVFVGNVPQGGDTEMPSLKYHAVSQAGNNAANIKAAAGVMTGWKVYNNADYPIFVKLYDKATTPAPGTDAVAQTIGVDAGLSDISPPGPGVTYTSGIGIAIVKGIVDGDDTPVAADDCVVDIFYQ